MLLHYTRYHNMKCGMYEVDITPALGCEIPGYFEVRIADGICENCMLMLHILKMIMERK